MKQQKKPKVFRTLIRRINTSGKEGRDDGNKPDTKSNDKQERQPPFFFGR